MRRLLVAVLVATLAAFGVGTAAGTGWLTGWGATAADSADAAELAPSHHARFDGAMTVAGLVVVVERANRRPVAGRKTTYTVAVGNRGTATEHVIIRAVVPPWLARVTAADGGEPGEGSVDWRITLAPGAASEFRLTGAYAAPGPDTPQLVALTACAHDPNGGEPIVCATDVAELRDAPSAARWLALGVVGLALVAGALAALTLLPGRRFAGVSWLARTLPRTPGAWLQRWRRGAGRRRATR